MTDPSPLQPVPDAADDEGVLHGQVELVELVELIDLAD